MDLQVQGTGSHLSLKYNKISHFTGFVEKNCSMVR